MGGADRRLGAQSVRAKDPFLSHWVTYAGTSRLQKAGPDIPIPQRQIGNVGKDADPGVDGLQCRIFMYHVKASPVNKKPMTNELGQDQTGHHQAEKER